MCNPLFLDSAAKTPTTEEHVRASSPLKDRNQQSSSKAPTSTPPTNHSQEKPKSKKGPTVTEIDDDGNLPSISPSPIPDLKTEIMQQVQNEVAKEILTKHKAEVEEGIQKRVSKCESLPPIGGKLSTRLTNHHFSR